MGARQERHPLSIDEIYAANRMTLAEYRRYQSEYREQMRQLSAGTEADAKVAAYHKLQADCRAAGIPEAFSHTAIDGRYASALGKGRGLWIFGPVGVGKTWSACAVARSWIAENGRGCIFATGVSMASDLRSAVSDGRGEERATARYAHARLLVLDDLGKEVPSEWGLAKLFDVVDRRYGARLPTIVTSQDPPDRIAARLAARGDAATAQAIVSRLVGTCQVRSLDGRDRRLGDGG